ncbi:MAG TPA: prolyl oligopeptidase family serine peptidase [Acidimicrobiales bacterium]|nr:prolyl oligopeptidase family serine peptidase [Acidimicrobiales bacterium]
MPHLDPAPVAPRGDTVDVLHGHEVADPYRWLEDANAPPTLAWVVAQNGRTRRALEGLPARAALHARFVELLAAPLSTSCSVAGDRVFALERAGGEAQFRLTVRSASDPDATPRPLIDPAALLQDSTAALDWYYPTHDGMRVAFGVSVGGDERSTLRIVDTESGDLLVDEIPDTRWASLAWTPAGDAFAYTRYPSGQEYGARVWWHIVGDHHGHDELVFGDLPIEESMQSVTLSRDGRWLAVHCNVGWIRTDVHLIDRETGRRTTLIEGVEAQTVLRVVDDRLIGVTNLDATRGRVFTASVDAPTAASWRTLVAESDIVIDAGGVEVAGDRLLVHGTRSALAVLRSYARDGGDMREIELPGPVSLAGFDAEPDRAVAFFQLESFALPARLHRWTPQHGVERWGTAGSPVDPDRFHVEQVRYTSTDGVSVPMFVMRGVDTVPSAGTPCLLTGYGGFSIAATPAYSPIAIAVAEAGGLFADACIRGGAEEGEEWHRAGMRESKQQVFDDFHAAGDWLVAEGCTSHARLALRGGSNGGLLMGAAITQRPELARAVHCAVPLLDMVRYHLHLIGKLWTPEYGDPDVAEELEWVLAYSPYHHVVQGTCYPAVLFTAAEGDGRVDPNHARKMTAALQWATSCGDDHPILLRQEDRAGHGAGKPLEKQADELADVLSFLWWQLGVA